MYINAYICSMIQYQDLYNGATVLHSGGFNQRAPVTAADSCFFFDLQARATSEIAVADLSDSENR